MCSVYCSTPHSTTGKTPSELMLGTTIRTKIPSIKDLERAPVSSDFRDADKSKKLEKTSTSEPGDTVLTKNLLPSDKLASKMNPEPYEVLYKEGPHVTVREKGSGKTLVRNSAHLKRIPQQLKVPLSPSSDQSSTSTQDTVSVPDNTPEMNQPTAEGLSHLLPSRSSFRPMKTPRWMRSSS